ncbi:MAG TPA: DNA polymerase domain-containing protein [Candidatus Thermoplasmatota archaeon]|nr:DNA polymerase domain-containing protein [Candidatus Thermoplasmatota archaeon]
MDGTLLDVSYEPPREKGVPGQAVVWVKEHRTGRVHRLAEPFTPLLYARTKRLAALERELPAGAGAPFRTRARLGLDEEEVEVLAVPVPDARKMAKVAQAIDAWGSYREVELFDADLRFSHRFFGAKGLFPFARVRVWAPGRYRLMDEQWSLDYPQPELKRLEMDARPSSPRGEIPDASTRVEEVTVGGRRHRGKERELLEILQAEIEEEDPDVIMTRGGDTFLLPYLYERAKAHDMELRFGREPNAPTTPARAGKSYTSYGKIKYMAPAYALAGRIHLDTITSFFYAEAGLHGLIDLSRVSRVPLQEVARLGAGTAITAIQIDLAKREGRLIPWKKNAPETFRSARSLLAGDRGGYIFEPTVGLHEDVVELDFASLYPNIMITRNISSEVTLCPCCAPPPEDGDDAMIRWAERMALRKVPQLDSWMCAQRTGFIPRSLAPVVARREAYKRMRKTDPENRRQHQECVDTYKWLLVTSFGYQGYKNAKFGRIECHEAIGAWGRDILLRTTEIAREHGFERVHGIVDALWLARAPDAPDLPSAQIAQDISRAVTDEIGIKFEYEGRYKWIVFLPNRRDVWSPHAPAVGALNRYYGCFDARPDRPNRSQPGQPVDHLAHGTLKVRGVEYRQHSTPPLVQEAQTAYLETLAPANDRAEFVALLPQALDAARPILERLRRGEVPLERLVYTNSVGRTLEEYRANTFAHAAVKQLHHAGVRVEAGQSVRYVVRDSRDREHARRVVETRLMRGDETYDVEHYEALVLRSIASLALPFGWDEVRLAARYGGTTQRTLPLLRA